MAVRELSNVTSPSRKKNWSFKWRVMFLFLSLTIGFRHEVGGDWGAYQRQLDFFTQLTLAEVFSGQRGDLGDTLLNWLSGRLNLGIYLVNIVYGVLFSWGLIVFCHKQPRPWLALTVAVPYLITVVAMGYSRQGVAIGLILIGLVALEDKRNLKFLLWVALASTFHKSAVILVPLSFLAISKNKLLSLLLIGSTALLLFTLMLQEYVEILTYGYLTAQYESSGALIRISMNALPAILFLLFRMRFPLINSQRTFWSWMSLGALCFVVVLYLSPSSTAVDRVALYWIPLQLFVWSRLPDVIGKLGGANIGWVYVVVGYSASVHFVWLFFADNSSSWLPYQFYPWVWLWQ